HTVLDWLSPWTDADILVSHPDSIEFYSLQISQVVNRPGMSDPVHIFDAGFDLSGTVWGKDSTSVPLTRGHVGYTFHDESALNEFTFAAQAEDGLGDPRTTYTKLAGVISDRFDLTRNWNAYLRLFGGSMQPIGGSLPTQTLFQLASPSDVDHFSDL